MVDFVGNTVDFVTSVYRAKATWSTFNKVDRVEFNFVVNVYRLKITTPLVVVVLCRSRAWLAVGSMSVYYDTILRIYRAVRNWRVASLVHHVEQTKN